MKAAKLLYLLLSVCYVSLNRDKEAGCCRGITTEERKA